MKVPQPWQDAARAVLALPPHAPLRLERGEVPHPEACGFYRSTGLNRAADAHFRFPLGDDRGLHALEFGDHFLVHWDRIDPSVSVLGHFVADVLSVTKRRVLGALGRVDGRGRTPAPVALTVALQLVR
ncbi:MAG: hypothetical protein ACPGQL_01825 [Thermoplasmatota archaeon]